MSQKRNNYSASKKAKIVTSAIEGKLTQAQLTSEYGALRLYPWVSTFIERQQI